MLLLSFVLIAITPLLWWFFNIKKFKSLANIQGPRPLPLIGNVLDIGNTPQGLLRSLLKFCTKYGEIYKLYVVKELKVIITHANLVEKVLTSNIHITKSDSYDLLIPWIGTGLLVSTDNKWKTRRKMITPTFHFKILEQFIETFNSASDVLINKLSKEVNKNSIDIYPFINLHSLDIICETAMGVQIKAQENSNKEYVTAVKSFLDIFIARVFSPWERFDLLFKLSQKYVTYRDNLKTLHQFTNSVVLKRRNEKIQKTSENKVSKDGIKRKTALLDLLLESENKDLLTNEDLREEIDTFTFEGHDTTTSGIAFAILALANHPDVQERVYQEIEAVIGSDENITMQHLLEMKYLDMVIKEVQRFYPSVPIFERRLETNFKTDDYDFPKGTTLSIFVYGLHHSKEHFPDPETFDPNRFLPDNQLQRHKFVYIPFSAGPRNCIGQKFALLEMKVTIIKIARHFKILQVPDYKPDLGIAAILKSYNGVCVQLQLRN